MRLKFTNHSSQIVSLFMLLALAVTMHLPGQSPLIEVKAEVDKSVITIGDRITYRLTIRRDKSLHIQSPGQGANLGIFEIKDYQFHPPKEENGRVIEQFDYVISVFDTGRYVIPPFPIAFLPSDTADQYQFISSEPIEIYVESILTAEDTEIRNIKPPKMIPRDYLQMALIAGAILLLMAAIFGGYWIYKKRKEGQPLFRREPIRPAHEIALAELQTLLESSLLIEGNFKGFYSVLSDILRRYIERRFYIKALEETTSEILMSLEEVEIDSPSIELVRTILRESDLVKFAKYAPEETDIQKTVEQTKQFILQTRLEFIPLEGVEDNHPSLPQEEAAIRDREAGTGHREPGTNNQ